MSHNGLLPYGGFRYAPSPVGQEPTSRLGSTQFTDNLLHHQVTRTINVVNTTPTVELIGDAEIRLECAIDTYSESGATATDIEDGDITDTIVVAGDTVDNSTLDTYTITYNVVDSFGAAADEVTRTVIVEDTTAPVITLTGDSIIQLRAKIDSYTEFSATVFDACDSSVELIIGGDTVDINTPGQYIVTYNAADSSENKAEEVTRTINVVNTAPTIELIGDAEIRLECTIDTYSEPGATATDIEDGDITNDLVVAGDSVNTSTLNSYTVTYNVVDSFGAAADEVTRTVIVEDTIAPVITLTGDSTIKLRAGIDSYTEFSATVFDACDSSVEVSIGGDIVDTNTIGVYIVTYNAADSSENEAEEVTRTINVVSPPQFSIAPLSASVSEGDIGTVSATFTITRSNSAESSGSIDWSIELAGNLTAADFAVTYGKVEFTAESNSKTLTVQVNGDNLTESDEAFTVTLSNASPTGALIDAENASANGTIINDDATPVANEDSAYIVIEDASLIVDATSGVLANDTDADDGNGPANLSISRLVDDVDYGSLTLNEDGSFTYIPAANYFGPE